MKFNILNEIMGFNIKFLFRVDLLKLQMKIIFQMYLITVYLK